MCSLELLDRGSPISINARLMLGSYSSVSHSDSWSCLGFTCVLSQIRTQSEKDVLVKGCNKACIREVYIQDAKRSLAAVNV